MYERTADVLDQHDLAQRITDAIATRTRVDLEANCFIAKFIRQASPPKGEERTVCTDGSNSPRAGSFGFTCTLDRCTLAHPPESFRWSDRTAQISLAPSANEVSFNEFCPYVCLVWKVEVLREKALIEVVVNSPSVVNDSANLMERACY